MTKAQVRLARAFTVCRDETKFAFCASTLDGRGKVVPVPLFPVPKSHYDTVERVKYCLQKITFPEVCL